jgi:hypothetical protein
MEPYKNLGGDSNVAAYEIASDTIKVQFRDGWIYTYTYQSAGQNKIEQMKTLAQVGQGLNSFIIKNVRKAYATKSK